MNLLPDFINPQPDEGLVADVRKLAEIAVSESGDCMTPELLEILTGMLVTGALTATSTELEQASCGIKCPEWVSSLLIGLHLLSAIDGELSEKRSYASRVTWMPSARSSINIAMRQYESTTP
jgi:hypothetical protein